jgi:RRXRR protein
MSRVLVVDANRRPLMPCSPARARILLTQGKAAVLRRYPFVLILKEAMPDARETALRLKIDPGAKTTGLAIVHETSGEVVWAAEITHHGDQVHKGLTKRAEVRRGRRQRHTQYRQPRWRNSRRPKGWLAPSLVSRLQNMLTWVARLRRFCPIGAISLELVRFDLALMQNPDIEGIEVRRVTRHGIPGSARRNLRGGSWVIQLT